MDADGSGQRRISFGGGAFASPVWSPRGDLIAFTRIGGAGFRIGTMSSSGGDVRLLTNAWQDEGAELGPQRPVRDVQPHRPRQRRVEPLRGQHRRRPARGACRPRSADPTRAGRRSTINLVSQENAHEQDHPHRHDRHRARARRVRQEDPARRRRPGGRPIPTPAAAVTAPTTASTWSSFPACRPTSSPRRGRTRSISGPTSPTSTPRRARRSPRRRAGCSPIRRCKGSIEGHADERGTREYNLALGRAPRQQRQEFPDRQRRPGGAADGRSAGARNARPRSARTKTPGPRTAAR